jgi:phosphatidylinositol glycan class B
MFSLKNIFSITPVHFLVKYFPIALISGYTLAVMERYDYDNRRKGSPVSHTKRPSKVGFSIFFLLVTNIPMAPFCMSLVHQVHEMHPPLH